MTTQTASGTTAGGKRQARTIELRVGMSLYLATLEQVSSEGWEVRWSQNGRTLRGVGESVSSAMADARSESRIAAGGQ